MKYFFYNHNRIHCRHHEAFYRMHNVLEHANFLKMIVYMISI